MSGTTDSHLSNSHPTGFDDSVTGPPITARLDTTDASTNVARVSAASDQQPTNEADTTVASSSPQDTGSMDGQSNGGSTTLHTAAISSYTPDIRDELRTLITREAIRGLTEATARTRHAASLMLSLEQAAQALGPQERALFEHSKERLARLIMAIVHQTERLEGMMGSSLG